MKKNIVSGCLTILIALPMHMHGNIVLALRGNSFLTPRSQTTNTARFLAGWQEYINKYNAPGAYGVFAITPEYMRSFRPKRIAEYFFGTNELRITGSQVVDRHDLDLLADYFGLSPSFESNILLEPVMQNMLADFSLYAGWGSYYFHAHAPVVRCNTRIHTQELIINNGSTIAFPANYMAENAIPEAYTSFTQAFKSGQTFGDVQPLNYGKLCCSQTRTALSDIQCALGYNFVNKDDGHFGVDLRVALPTGTKPRAVCLFEPMVGNGKHWGIGAGFSGHGLIWEKDGEQEWNVVVDAHVSHLCKTKQLRSFDFIKNGFGSRYILMKMFDETQAYTGITIPTINASTLLCDVSIPVEFEGAVMFAYTYDCFGFDIGYNAWLRSREHISCPALFPDQTYGFKGIQNVTIGSSLPSPATQSRAHLHGDYFINQGLVADLNPPVFAQRTDINLTSAENPMAFTHKIFWHFQYNGGQTCFGKGYIGCGGEVEFEGFRPKYLFQPNHVAMSQWGLWLKTGLAY